MRHLPEPAALASPGFGHGLCTLMAALCGCPCKHLPAAPAACLSSIGHLSPIARLTRISRVSCVCRVLRRVAQATGAALLAGLAACATVEPAPPPAPPPGLADLLERPAERALYEGQRAYDDAQYAAAETALRQALSLGLRSLRDRATAHKLLAFITCTSERLDLCEAAFRAARNADSSFVLNRAESGHPVWGPVYRRLQAP